MGDFQKEKQEGVEIFSKRSSSIMDYPCPTRHSKPLESFAGP